MSYNDLSDLRNKLADLDEVTLIELLELNTDDILDMCWDRVQTLQHKLFQYVKEEQD